MRTFLLLLLSVSVCLGGALPIQRQASFPAPAVIANSITYPTNLQYITFSSSLGGALTQNSWLTVPLPEPTQSGNTVIVGMQGGSSSYNMTGGFKESSTTILRTVITNYDSGNLQWMMLFIATNVPSGCRTILLTNRAAASVQYFSGAASEACNIAAYQPVDRINGNHATSATITAGSFTPSQTGDLIWQYAVRDSGTISTANFTNGSQANMDWKLLTTDLADGTACQAGIYSSASAINPTLTAASSAGFISCAVALKASPGQGSFRPSGPYIVAIHHLSQAAIGNSFAATETDLTNHIQVPMQGNLIVMAVSSAGDMFITNTTSSTANTFYEAPGGPNRNGTTSENTQFIYATNATPANYAFITNKFKNTTTGGVGVDATILVYDIVGASVYPYDTRTVNVGDQTVTGDLTAPGNLTPSVSGGIYLALEQHFVNTATNLTSSSLLFDATWYTSMNLDGPQNMDQNGGWLHYHVPNTSTLSPTWKFRGNYAIGTWAADSIYFKP